MAFTDEILMAYADGELDPQTAADVRAAESTDETVAGRIALFRATRQAVAAIPAPPVSDALVEAVRRIAAQAAVQRHDPSVVLLADRRTGRDIAGRQVPLWQLPAAAAVALAVGLAFGLQRTDRGAESGDEVRVAVLDATGLAAVLAKLPAGESGDLPDGSTLTPVASFTTDTGEFCREFELDRPDAGALVSVACHTGEGWDLRLAVVSGADDSSYAPASSLEVLDSWMLATGAGAPLSPEEEATALAGLN